MQHGLLGCQNHVKRICTYKGRPIDINDAASSTECRKCAFQPVCAFERASVLGPGHSHLFPSRMDLMEATGHGADRFIRVVIWGCPVSQAALLQLPGPLGNHDGLQVDWVSIRITEPLVLLCSEQPRFHRLSSPSCCRSNLFGFWYTLYNL